MTATGGPGHGVGEAENITMSGSNVSPTRMAGMSREVARPRAVMKVPPVAPTAPQREPTLHPASQGCGRQRTTLLCAQTLLLRASRNKAQIEIGVAVRDTANKSREVVFAWPESCVLPLEGIASNARADTRCGRGCPGIDCA